MRQSLALAVFVFALAGSHGDEKVSAPVPKDPPPPSIDGKYTAWSVSSTPRAAKGLAATNRMTALGPATITKKEILLEGRGTLAAQGALGMAGLTTMEYTLDPTKTPMTIDVETENVRGKKAKSLGIVEVTGTRMVIALAKEGDERPKTTDEAEGVTLYYFQRVPPPPKTEFRIVAMTVGKEEEAEKELNKLAAAGYELVTTTNPAAANDKAAPTTVHFILKRTAK